MLKQYNIYKENLSEILQKENDDYVVFLFGFPNSAFIALNELGINHFSGIKFDENKPIYQQLTDNSEIRKKFFKVSGKNWGFYEEFIELSNKFYGDFSDIDQKIIIIENNIYQDYYPIENINNPDEFISIIQSESIENDSVLINYYIDYQYNSDQLYVMFINLHHEIRKNMISKFEVFDFYRNHKQESEQYFDKKSVKIINYNDIQLLTRQLEMGKIENTQFLIESTTNIQNNDSNDLNIEALNCLGQYYNVNFKNNEAKIVIKDDVNKDYLKILKKYWNSDNFRDLKFYKNPSFDTEITEISQGTLITDIINQSLNAQENSTFSDIIITAPTGSGKSVIFQIPAIFLHQKINTITIVVTPLIALMEDQVTSLKEKGIDFATFINSDITYEQRQSRLEEIKSGRISIIYISPESLLSNDLKTYIGERKIGLMIVDEAHIVTSWGRDFRVDYWFLGDFIEKTRKGSHLRTKISKDTMEFPVVCLTATAVFGGRDDVVVDLQQSLNINVAPDHIYIGNVRRDNIEFKIIKHEQKEHSREIDSEKTIVTAKRVKEFIENNVKTIVYFPYKKHISDVLLNLNDILGSNYQKVSYYFGGLDKFEKSDSYTSFKENNTSVMLSTKAFGMGVDIPDIQAVYHFAPTGTLSDYVQEIGRAARKPEINGFAMTDYYKKDMRYANTLWGLSGLRHYQLKYVLKKLLELYEVNKNKNMLINPEIFSSIFSDSVENKSKSALMLIASDLFNKFGYKVLIVRPSNMFTVHYVNIGTDIFDDFNKEFSKYIKPIDKVVNNERNFRGVREIVRTDGTLHEIHLSKMWEEKFSNLSYANFKYNFFEGKLFDFKDKVHPRTKLTIHYLKNFELIKKLSKQYAKALHEIFHEISSSYGKQHFTLKEFDTAFSQKIDLKLSRDFKRILLEMFCLPDNTGFIAFEKEPIEDWRFIKKERSENEFVMESTYSINSIKYSYVSQNINRYIENCKPNSNENEFVTYLGIPRGKNKKRSEEIFTASLLEMFGLATFELEGGKNAEIFIRINNSLTLNRIVKDGGDYKNQILTEIESRHKRAANIVEGFLNTNLTNIERWDLIEQYFLGNDGIIDNVLGIGE